MEIKIPNGQKKEEKKIQSHECRKIVKTVCKNSRLHLLHLNFNESTFVALNLARQ